MHLPADWTRILPPDAPLTTLERWERVFADTKPGDWPEGVDRSSFVLDILRLLAKGTVVAAEAGERLLPTLARKLSDRALEDGPPAALPVTLASLRIEDGLEPASHPIWTSAVSLASAPRPFVRLLGLNAGRWPRRISEDRLIPDHIIPIEEVDPLPLADADRRDFATIIARATKALDPDPFPRHSLRHAVYAALLHFGFETAADFRAENRKKNTIRPAKSTTVSRRPFAIVMRTTG